MKFQSEYTRQVLLEHLLWFDDSRLMTLPEWITRFNVYQCSSTALRLKMLSRCTLCNKTTSFFISPSSFTKALPSSTSNMIDKLFIPLERIKEMLYPYFLIPSVSSRYHSNLFIKQNKKLKWDDNSGHCRFSSLVREPLHNLQINSACR